MILLSNLNLDCVLSPFMRQLNYGYCFFIQVLV